MMAAAAAEAHESNGADADKSKNTVAENYMDKLQDDWKSKRNLPGEPWIRPRDPLLEPLNVNPETHYRPIVFAWLPEIWGGGECPRVPKCPHCLNNEGKMYKDLKPNGFTRKRMLLQSMENAYCITRRWVCEECQGCKTDGGKANKSRSYTSWDPVMRQALPSGIQSIFNFDLQHRVIVDMKLIDDLLFLSVHDSSIASIAHFMKERAVKAYLERERAWKSRLAAHRGAGQPPFSQVRFHMTCLSPRCMPCLLCRRMPWWSCRCMPCWSSR